MEQWNKIRQRVLRDGVSIRQIQRETGLHFETVKKILAHPSPQPFQSPERPKPKVGPYLERIAAILKADKDAKVPRKQRLLKAHPKPASSPPATKRRESAPSPPQRFAPIFLGERSLPCSIVNSTLAHLPCNRK